MSIRQMQAYADLRRQGDATANARLTLLEAHQQHVREHMRELENHLAVIEKKMHHLRSRVSDEMKGKEDDQERALGLLSITAQRKGNHDGEIVLQHNL